MAVQPAALAHTMRTARPQPLFQPPCRQRIRTLDIVCHLLLRRTRCGRNLDREWPTPSRIARLPVAPRAGVAACAWRAEAVRSRCERDTARRPDDHTPDLHRTCRACGRTHRAHRAGRT